MQPDPDRLLNQLVVSALTIFVALIIVLGVLLLRQVSLHQRLANASVTLQEDIDDLEETTQELQSELDEIRSSSEDGAIVENLEDVSELLQDVDDYLDSIEESFSDVESVLEEPLETISSDPSPSDVEREIIQDQVDQLFTILAALVGATSVVIAILLGLAIRIQHRQTIHF
jgi:uncharacterized phage infection (PIP) family protein YhgE